MVRKATDVRLLSSECLFTKRLVFHAIGCGKDIRQGRICHIGFELLAWTAVILIAQITDVSSEVKNCIMEVTDYSFVVKTNWRVNSG